MLKNKIIAAVCCCFALAATLALSDMSSQNAYKNAITIARNEIWQSINSGKCGSGSAAIMVDGEVVYAEGFGMANRAESIPVTPDTLFNIGSISKVYAATAIMLLVDDGKVSLDKPVVKYLHEFKMADPRYKDITVRMLLNHTSGMPGTEGANSFGYKYNDKFPQETLDTLSHSHLKAAPGRMAAYCNDGFTLAEMIVERVSGKKYIDFLKARIFSPLDLKNTSLSVGAIPGKVVANYYDPKTGKIYPLEVLSLIGAGALAATPTDICGFSKAFFPDSKLLTKQSLAEMLKAQPSAFKRQFNKYEFPYGLGWDATNFPRYAAAGIQVLAKRGGTGKYSSMVYTVPDKKITVAVLTAGTASGVAEIAAHMLDAVLADKQLIAKEVKPILMPVAAQKIPQSYAAFNGYYVSVLTSALNQIVFNFNQKVVNLYKFNDKEKTLVISLVYNNGYFYDADHNHFSFLRIGGSDYVVAGVANLDDFLTLEKIKPIAKPQRLRIDMNGKKWLRRNIYPFESDTFMSSHSIQSWLYKELPGYVYLAGIKKIKTPNFAGMPFSSIPDQTELTLLDKNGVTWAQLSDMLYSPISSARVLQLGKNAVTIGSDGYNEWLVANDDVILSFTKPEHSRMIVFSPDMEAIYDSALDTGDIYVKKGSYIELDGFAKDVLVVAARKQ